VLLSQEEVQTLQTLARDPSDGARQRLADQVVSLTRALKEPNAETTFGDIVVELIRGMPPGGRHRQALAFGRRSDVPSFLVERLVEAEPAVAVPYIRTSNQLTSHDLCLLAERASVPQLCAIAAREVLTQDVINRLLERQSEEATVALMANMSIRIASRAFQTLLARARTAASVHAGLVRRPELTVEDATALYWWLSQDMRDILASRVPLALAPLRRALAADLEPLAWRAASADRQAVLHLAHDLSEAGLIDGPTLSRLKLQGLDGAVREALRVATRLPASAIARALSPEGKDQLAVIARALDLGRSCLLTLAGIEGGLETAHALAETHDLIDGPTARRTLDHWVKNPEFLTRSCLD